jgi:ABC-type transport system substrate-binding protein
MSQTRAARLFTRRTFLASLTVAGVGSLIAACGASTSLPAPAVPPTIQPTATAAPAVAKAATGLSGPAAGPNAVIVSTNAEAGTFNPLLSSDGASLIVQEPIFESLVRADPKTGAAVPWLAERWNQSQDGLTYTFHPRPNVTWSTVRRSPPPTPGSRSKRSWLHASKRHCGVASTTSRPWTIRIR